MSVSLTACYYCCNTNIMESPAIDGDVFNSCLTIFQSPVSFVYLLIKFMNLSHSFWFIVFSDLFQVSRSIGDVYLKKAEYNREPLYAKFRLREPFKRPILSSEPSISVHELQPHDQFLIFASDGLWEHLSNQEAVDIVKNHPRNVRIFYFILFSVKFMRVSANSTFNST